MFFRTFLTHFKQKTFYIRQKIHFSFPLKLVTTSFYIMQNNYTQIIVHNKQKHTLKFVHIANRQCTNICVYYDHSKQQNNANTTKHEALKCKALQTHINDKCNS